MGIAAGCQKVQRPEASGVAILLLLMLLLGACRDDRPEGQVQEEPGRAGAGGEASLPLSASLSRDSSRLDQAPEPGDSPDLVQARQVLEAYYGAISAGDYERAYSYWGDSGRASGQSFLEFVAGFAETARATVVVRQGGRIEGAAGSRYVELPVEVTATRKKDERQRFEGSYTLRRVVVDGASPEQRRWHLYDGDLRPAP